MNGQTSEQIFKIGIKKYGRNDYTGAIQEFSKAIKLDLKNYAAFASRGNAKIYINDFKGAIDDCNTAIKLNPKFADAYTA